METLDLTLEQARRYILGRQGLWPGRRWRGLEGVGPAVREMEALQLDPLNIAARSQDIALYSRVLDYRPEHLDEWAYNRRAFFDYGGALHLYPMEELPFYQHAMQAARRWPRWARFAAEKPEVIEHVQSELAARGPLSNRDFAGERVDGHYRGRKDTALALYYLWITGRVMIHHRRRFERVYHLREQVAPPEHLRVAPEEEAAAHFARKAVAAVGLARLTHWRAHAGDALGRTITKEEGQAWLDELVAEGVLLPVRVRGWKDTHYALAEDLPLLEEIQAGRVPAAWQPLEATTEEEALLLAPLEIVSARGRAKQLFHFDYVWEVYKPVEQRRWGYYTLPVLVGERLAARLDPRLERADGTLRILGFWLEESERADDPQLASALGRGLARFAAMTGAERIDIGTGPHPLLARAAAQFA